MPYTKKRECRNTCRTYYFRKGHLGYWRGKKLPKKTRINMSLAQKERFKNTHSPMYGKHHSEKTKEKMRKAQIGSKSWAWADGRSKTTKGYILIKNHNHPFRDKQNYVLEHRLVMEKILGRYLYPDEIVHHKGTKYTMGSFEDRKDNRLKNLKLFPNKKEHSKFHRLKVIGTLYPLG